MMRENSYCPKYGNWKRLLKEYRAECESSCLTGRRIGVIEKLQAEIKA